MRGGDSKLRVCGRDIWFGFKNKGPLLFLLYINDIVEDINSSIRLFADDTTLYIIVDNPLHAANQLNSDLSKIHQWATKWLVTFNPSKSESIIFSRKRNKPNHPNLVMDQQSIQEVNSHRHLGLVLSNDCTWHDHLEYIKSKAWTRINVMRKLKFKLDRRSLQIIYFTFIRPILEYADVVWNNCTQYEVNELEKIQNEAARIVTGATKLVSINSLMQETGWETLSNRRKKHKLFLFYKMQHQMSPDYLSSLVRQLLEVLLIISYGTLQIYLLFMQVLSCTLILSYRLL